MPRYINKRNKSSVLSIFVIRGGCASSGAGHVPAAIVATSAPPFAALSHGISDLGTHFLEITFTAQLAQWLQLVP